MLLRCSYVELVYVLCPVAFHGDRELAVAWQAGGRRDELADYDVLLQAGEAINLALYGGVGEDAGGLLEGGCREEAVGGEGGLGYAHQHRVVSGGAAFLLLGALVFREDREAVGDLLGEQFGVARVVDDDLAEHLAYYHLDVLVVDIHALGLVDLLHLVHQVTLGGSAAAAVAEVVFEDGVRIDGAFRDRGVSPDLGALHELRLEELALDLVLAHVGVVRGGDDHLDQTVRVSLLEGDDTVDLRQRCLGLGVTSLEELDDPRETGRDVLAGDTTGVERTHGELGTRLADGLGRDDAYGLGTVGRERPAVAGLAHALRALALGGRTHRNERLTRQLILPGGEQTRRDVRACLGDELSRLGVDEVAG